MSRQAERHTGRDRGRWWVTVIALSAVPLALATYFNVLAPRPYYVLEDDAEAPSYFSARLILTGQPLAYYSHPGTPVYYTTAAVMHLIGDGAERPQRLFQLMRTVVAGLTTAALVVAAWTCVSNQSWRVAAVFLTMALAWPTVPTYLEYFDTNSFVLPLGMLTLAAFWVNVERGSRPSQGLAALAGLGLGLCLATKLSFLPVATAVLAGVSVQQWTAVPSRGRWLRLMVLPCATAVAFLVATAPIVGRLPNLGLILVGRDGIRPAGDTLFASFIDGAGVLATANPVVAILVAALVAAWLWSVLAARRVASAADSDSAARGAAEPAAALTFAILLGALAYALACVEAGRDPGIALRNTGPAALVLPFLGLYAVRMPRRVGRRRPSTLLLVVAGVAALAVAVHTRLEHRGHLRERARVIATTVERLETMRRPGTRIAFFEESSVTLLGEVSFHLTGNYHYANGVFDAALLRRFPDYTLLRLPEVPRLLNARSQPDAGRGAHPDRGRSFGLAGQWWRQVFPEPYPTTAGGELVNGESAGVTVSLVAVPERELSKRLEDRSEREFLQLVASRLGPVRRWTESIAGVPWALIAVDEAGR